MEEWNDGKKAVIHLTTQSGLRNILRNYISFLWNSFSIYIFYPGLTTRAIRFPAYGSFLR